jgi:hypothetical protein
MENLVILRKTEYDKWFPEDSYYEKDTLETLLKKFFNKGYKIIGMSEDKIILEKESNPSSR